MKTIDTNSYYTIGVDTEMNRIHIELNGFWKDTPPQYLEHIDEAIKLVKQGFTVLADLTRLKAPPQNVSYVHIEAQKLLTRKGLSKTAELRPSRTITTLAARKWASNSNLNVRVFENYHQAIEWLN